MKTMSWSQQVGAAVLLVALGVLVAGCKKGDGGGGGSANNPNVTKENYEKIKDGMSEAGVIGIMGPPTETNTPPNHPNMKGLTWINGNDRITVSFKDGKVEMKTNQFVK
jgi:hypothetical protein